MTEGIAVSRREFLYFNSLCGKMDASNPYATIVEDYVGGTSNRRTDWYATCGTVISHAESIELFKKLGVKMTPELKTPSVEMPYETTMGIRMKCWMYWRRGLAS